ncbi:MAG: 16S rRNA (uracil(1498)-N(3))-methyltransferase [Ruminiclostridium sp.]|nr:16S rRNA (uracil(1498)-N(3))-methyltransferase [Ruminiclostridium sp.]
MKLNEGFEKTITPESVERWRYPRFFTENVGECAVITGSDAAHITKVLRMKRGDLAVVCDGNGTDMLCRITSASDGAVELEILDRRASEGEPTVYLRLFQCMPKSDKMDFIVQKAVELGAAEVIPVISKRCVSRPDPKSAEKKRGRWQRIADEAAKQCGRGRIPAVGSMIAFDEAVGRFGGNESCGIIFYECGGKRLGEIVAGEPRNIDIFIGSEGGFEEEEVGLAKKAGIVPATLGTRILRCETAPVAAIAVLMNLTNNM